MSRMAATKPLRHKHLYRLSDQFVARVTKQHFHLPVDEHDPTSLVHHDVSVRRRFNGQSESFFAAFELG